MEWVHAQYSRSVCLVIKVSPVSLILEKPRGGLIRKIDMAGIRTLTATLAVADFDRSKTEDIPPFLLLHIPNSYDSVRQMPRSL